MSESGVIENQYDYDIWGNPTLTLEQYSNAIRYAGEFLDSETGLYYLRARYYNPYTGRFISEDSYWGEDSNPLSLNRYTYTHNDPIQYVDPTGHWEWGDSDLKDTAKSKILDLTNKWENAKSDDEKAKIHDEAQAIRDSKDNYSKSNVGKDYHNKVSDTGKELDKVMASDGSISKKDWNRIHSSMADSKENVTLFSGVNGDEDSFGFWSVEDQRKVNWHFGDETTQLYSREDGYGLNDGKGNYEQTRYDGVKALQDKYMTGHQTATVIEIDTNIEYTVWGNEVYDHVKSEKFHTPKTKGWDEYNKAVEAERQAELARQAALNPADPVQGDGSLGAPSKGRVV